jgi:transglutaminase-like putative cysteine protease
MTTTAAPHRPLQTLQTLRTAAATLLAPQASSAARERRDVLALLLAIAFVVVPHFQHLPLWSSGVLAALWLWRLTLALTQRPLPGRLALVPLLMGVTAAVWFEHRTLIGRDAGVNFLLMLLALKLLELRARRDIFVVVLMAFLILLTQFTYGQGIVVALMTLAAVMVLFAVLVSVNLTDNDLTTGVKLKLVGALLLKAVPLTVALFVLFPRLTSPLWSMPADSAAARSGLSSSMSPGNIGRLLESDEIAFRALFASTPPPPERLYWRGPVLGVFNGRTWTPRSTDGRSAPPSLRALGTEAADYTVTLEPTRRDWLFALDMPVDASGAADLSPRLLPDGQLVAGRLITERTRYRLRSVTEFRLGDNETPLALQAWLQLPPGFNPRTLDLALQLRREVPGAMQSRSADAALVSEVLRRFNQEKFVYTLQPPTLGRNSVDEFLFDTRAGFCEHYASAFVVLMRALDIPARVVTGYQGGEYNPVDGFLTIRQSDAHAWAEVWLAGRGWVRVDPTAAVAPERVQRGGTPRTAAAGGGAAPVFGEQAFSLMRAVRFRWEALENGWNQWVLSYSQERQLKLLDALGLVPDTRTLAFVFAVVISLIMVVLGALSLRHRSQRDPLGELLADVRRRLNAVGIDAPDHWGPRAIQAASGPRLDPRTRAETEALLKAIEQLRYARPAQANSGAVGHLRRRIRRYRPRVAS